MDPLPTRPLTRDALAADYAAMAEMFMVEPPNFDELLAGLADLEKRINQAAATS